MRDIIYCQYFTLVQREMHTVGYLTVLYIIRDHNKYAEFKVLYLMDMDIFQCVILNIW